MMRSLYSGVSGLRNHQTKMDVIGDNISNVNTVGFKKSTVNFQDLMVQTMRGASAPQGGRGGTNAMQVGLGMGVGSINVVNTQGNLQNTGKTTDLAIDGDGFFIVANGDSQAFTRTGTLDIDTDGNLIMTNNGMKIMGWQADDNGVINNSDVSGLGAIKIRVGKSIAATASSNVAYDKNLDSSTEKAISTSVDVYDSLGNKHSINITFKKPMSSIDLQWFRFDTNPAGSTHSQDIATYDVNGELHNLTLTVTSKDGITFDLSLAEGANTILSASNKSPTDLSSLTSTNPLFPSPFALTIPAATNAKNANDAQAAIDAAKFAIDAAKTAADAAKTAADAAKAAAENASANPTDTSLADAAKTAAENAKTAAENAKTLADAAKTAAENAKLAADATVADKTTTANPTIITQVENILTKATDFADEAETAVNNATNAAEAANIHAINLNIDSANNLQTAATSTQTASTNAQTIITDAQTAAATVQTTAITYGTAKNNALAVTGGTEGSPVYSAAANSWEWIADTVDSSIIKSNPTAPLQSGTLLFDTNGVYSAVTNNTLDLQFDNGASSITALPIDFKGLTQYANETTATGTANGYPSGSLQSISIDESGTITGAFSNGLTQPIGQVAIAAFSNPGGLTRMGGSLYTVSNNSGKPDVGVSGNGGRGMIKPGTLEMSNVDLAQEFTDMIVTQRGFQANSKIISTTDEMLEQLVNLKR